MLKLKLQYSGHLMRRAHSLEKTLRLGNTEGRRRGWHHQLNGREFEQALGDGEGQGGLVCCTTWGFKELGITQWLNNNEIKLIPNKKYTMYTRGLFLLAWHTHFQEEWLGMGVAFICAFLHSLNFFLIWSYILVFLLAELSVPLFSLFSCLKIIFILLCNMRQKDK